MKKLHITLILLVSLTWALSAQIYFSRDGNISFYSDAPLEKIEAQNKNATSVIDLENQKIEFAVLIKAFQFKKALMQQHFNENYLESDKYPKAEFKGNFSGFTIDKSVKDGTYPVTISGVMTIHGVSKEIATEGTFIVHNSTISGQSSLEVAVADYEIKIPNIVREKIAKSVKISVDVAYQPLESN